MYRLQRTPQDGQAFLIVVLVMVIALTVGLSIASRTITNLRVSTEEENSQKAFSAAESGIEQALKSGNYNSNTLSNNAFIKSLTITQVGENSTQFLINNG